MLKRNERVVVGDLLHAGVRIRRLGITTRGFAVEHRGHQRAGRYVARVHIARTALTRADNRIRVGRRIPGVLVCLRALAPGRRHGAIRIEDAFRERLVVAGRQEH